MMCEGLRKGAWNCLQQIGQDVEKAFDTLAVFDTRPFPRDCHVMGSSLQSPNNGDPSHPLFFCVCLLHEHNVRNCT